jgi:Protein of unknown function (DUF1573)
MLQALLQTDKFDGLLCSLRRLRGSGVKLIVVLAGSTTVGINVGFLLIGLSDRAGPRLIISETSLDFGTLPTSNSATKLVLLRNEGMRSLEIEDVHGSCGCTEVAIDKKTLARGEVATLKMIVTGQPAELAYIFVKSNDRRRPNQVIEIRYKEPVRVIAIPTQVDFHHVSHLTLPQTKRVVLKFLDKSLYSKVTHIGTRITSEFVKVEILSDEAGNQVFLDVTLLATAPTGRMTYNMQVIDSKHSFRPIDVGIDVSIPSDSWSDPGTLVVGPFAGKEAAQLSRVIVKYLGAIQKDRQLALGVHFDTPLLDLIGANVVEAQKDGGVVIQIFEKAHNSPKRIVPGRELKGHLFISEQGKQPLANEAFSIPVVLLLGQEH